MVGGALWHSGVKPDPAWLSALLRLGLPVFCGFDADPTGEAMAQRLIQLHPSVRRLRPLAKDWNDALRLHRCVNACGVRCLNRTNVDFPWQDGKLVKTPRSRCPRRCISNVAGDCAC